MALCVVTATDHLYEGSVGSVIWEDRTRIYLQFSDDKELFNRNEVERII